MPSSDENEDTDIGFGAGDARLQPVPDVVAEGPVLGPVPVDGPGHQALELPAVVVPGLADQVGGHVAGAGALLGGQAGDLHVVGELEGEVVDGEALVQAVGLGDEALDGAGWVRVAFAVVHLAVVVLHVQPPKAAAVDVLLNNEQVRAPDTAVGRRAAGHVRRLGRHCQAEVLGHLVEDPIDDADQVRLTLGQLVYAVVVADQAGLDVDVDAVEVVLLQDRDDGRDELVRDLARGEVDGGRGAPDGQ